jgi:hypothetical protein
VTNHVKAALEAMGAKEDGFAPRVSFMRFNAAPSTTRRRDGEQLLENRWQQPRVHCEQAKGLALSLGESQDWRNAIATQ